MLSTVIEYNPYKNISCMTLNSVLEKYKAPKEIDYLSIDVEGSEMNVLKGLTFENYDIKLITIEHNAYVHGVENKNKIFNFLSEKGFKRIKEIGENGESNKVIGLEDWYIHQMHLK